MGSKAQRRRLRDRRVAIRHALCHTAKLQKSIGEFVKLPDTSVEDCFVSESLERSSAKKVTGRGGEDKMTSIVTSILCLDEKLNKVSGYVLCLGQLLKQCLEAGPHTAEILLNTLTESQKHHTYDFYTSPDSINSKSTLDPHAGGFISKSGEVFESSWEPLESSHIDLDGKVAGFSVTAGVDGETDIPDTTVPSHHVAPLRDCDVKPYMTDTSYIAVGQYKSMGKPLQDSCVENVSVSMEVGETEASESERPRAGEAREESNQYREGR